MAYLPGGTFGICDQCGGKFRLYELKKQWNGLRVCAADFDPPPRDDSPPSVKAEGVPLPNSRPDNQQDNAPNLTTAASL